MAIEIKTLVTYNKEMHLTSNYIKIQALATFMQKKHNRYSKAFLINPIEKLICERLNKTTGWLAMGHPLPSLFFSIVLEGERMQQHWPA